VPNVEDRLPLLIQKQLNAKIKQHPPLFPWETEVDDYEANDPESGHSKPINTPNPLTSLFKATNELSSDDNCDGGD
jgi:hypothetical protein